MTFDLVLSSLCYHAREWFVFQDILTHLPQEKAAAATLESKTTQKYTYRFGITRDWVTGDGKKVLVDRHFIDSNDSGRSLVFSSVLIDAERVEKLFLESFHKRFRLKVQQFHLTATTLDSAWFEWQFDPKQKDGCFVKKTRLTEESCQSTKPPESTAQKNQDDDTENVTPNLSNENRQTPLGSKRRRAISDNVDQPNPEPNSNFSPPISETVLTRPRKKAKEANLSISKYIDQPDQEIDERPGIVLQKEEPMSPDFKPDLANLHNIKTSLSPMEKPKINLSPCSPKTPIKNDVMLSSVGDNSAGKDTDCISPSNDNTQETNTTSQENNVNSQNSENLSGSEDTGLTNDMSQDNMALDGQDMPNLENAPNHEANEPEEACSIPDSTIIQQNAGSGSDDSSMVDHNNSGDNSSIDDGNIGPQNGPTSPASSQLDNTNTIMENIKLQKQELCTDEEEVVVECYSSEVPSTSADRNKPRSHKHDCGAEACSIRGASSTVCLCSEDETSKQETSGNIVSTGMSCVLCNFIAITFALVIEYYPACVPSNPRFLVSKFCMYCQWVEVLRNAALLSLSINFFKYSKYQKSNWCKYPSNWLHINTL
jgi:hypothetical protein